jgi:hypothetical protein
VSWCRHQSLTFTENDLSSQEIDRLIDLLTSGLELTGYNGSKWRVVSVVPSFYAEGGSKTSIEVICVGGEELQHIPSLQESLRKKLEG